MSNSCIKKWMLLCQSTKTISMQTLQHKKVSKRGTLRNYQIIKMDISNTKWKQQKIYTIIYHNCQCQLSMTGPLTIVIVVGINYVDGWDIFIPSISPVYFLFIFLILASCDVILFITSSELDYSFVMLIWRSNMLFKYQKLTIKDIVS
jgi:hypothetical protein